MSKYQPLRKFLENARVAEVPMTFEEIERVLGFPLPDSQRIRAWWSNNPSNNVMTKEWLAAGYQTAQVDIDAGKLVFRRTGADKGEDDVHEPPQAERKPRRHPGFGLMKGLTTIVPGTDLTAPLGGDWGRRE